jgi:mannose-6-phosphate isomerase-like protein (cupin superfamily)
MGYSFDIFIDPSDRVRNDFLYTTNELVTVMDGKLKLTIGGEEIIAEPGDEVFIPQGVRHSVKNLSSATAHRLYGHD